MKFFLKAYQREVGLPFAMTGFTFNQINEKIFRDFLNAGIDSVIFGIESACEKTKKMFSRHESKAQILRIDELNYNLKKEFSLHVQYDIILDSPWETPDDALESLAFVVKLKGYYLLDIFSLRLLPGTKLFQRALEEGILKQEDVDKENRRVYRSLNHTYENFLFLLVRDHFLRDGWFFWLLTRPGQVAFMRRVFKRWGKGIFNAYSSCAFSALVFFQKKKFRLGWLIKRLGFKKACGVVKNKIFKKFFKT